MQATILRHYPRIATVPRIVVLISTRIVGGPAKGLLQVIPDLHRRGRFEVVLCTFAGTNEAESPFIAAAHACGIQVTILRQRHHWDLRPILLLRKLLDSPGAIIQTHGYKEAVFGLAVKRLSGRPWIAFMHGTTEENVKVRLYHRLDRVLTGRADVIVSVSRELADRMVKPRHRTKLAIIENAIERPLGAQAARSVRRPSWRTQGSVIGCIGRLSREKGQMLLLEAAGRLARQGARFTLVLAGDGPDRDLLHEKADTEGVGGRVRFLGHVARADEIYANIDMLVLPSYREGMPNVILEAMQWRLPIVATAVGAVPEMLVHGVSGLLVHPGDSIALARAMASMISDPDKAERMGRKAGETLYPRFSLERRVELFESLYSRVLEAV